MSKETVGRYGEYGGQYVPDVVMPALKELEDFYGQIKNDPEFKAELEYYLREYAGRPTGLYFAENLTRHYGRGKIYLKREDLLHTGAHKINNAIGQALVARRMGKKKIIAETGAGQHGVAAATVAALFGMECEVFMGEEDMRRQELNVFRMRLLGAKVTAATHGTGTLSEAVDAAIGHWVENVEDCYFLIGSAVGPHPYPEIVRDFQSVIGEEVRESDVKPDYLVACIGGGSNAIGLLYPFRNDQGIKRYGVEAAGRGFADGDHAATMTMGRPGVLHGSFTYILQDENGKDMPAYSISAGLDYPGVGPEHSYFKDAGIVKYVAVTDSQALEAFERLAKIEGIIPALESSHALAFLEDLMPQTQVDEIVVVNLSGRGDKDVQQVAEIMGDKIG